MKKKSYNIGVFVRDQAYLDQIDQYLEKSYKNIENITITNDLLVYLLDSIL